MTCIKCKKELPDGAVYCCWCGKKQVIERKRSRKRANSQGTVYKVSGNRSKPWVAVLPCKYVEGKSKRTVLGYYPTKTEALDSLNMAVTSNVTDRINMTLEDCYNEWSKNFFKEVGEKRVKLYRIVWNKFEPLYKYKIKDIRANDVQLLFDEIEESGKGLSMCKDMKILYSKLCRYAMSLDIIYQDYAQFLKLPKYEKTKRKAFTQEQVDQIYEIAKSGDETAMIVCILIYTGFRIGELFDIRRENVNIEESYMIGGEKTEAGKDRLIPFNDKIIKFIEYFYKKETEYLVATPQGHRYDINNFNERCFKKLMKSIGITDMTPHCTRHTFATLGQAAGVRPEDMIKLIGHTDYSMTTDHYIHQNLETLRNAINMIK